MPFTKNKIGPVSRGAQRAAFIFIALPSLGALVALLVCIFGPPVAPIQWWMTLVLFLIGTYGIELGFHRLYSHRAFKATRLVEVCLGIAGSTSAEGSLLFWVELHRRHHPNADRETDPHSPRPLTPGVPGKVRGFFHAHVGWMFSNLQLESLKLCSDLIRNPIALTIDRYYARIVLLGLLVPALVGGLATRSFIGALHGLLLGGFTRIFLVQQVTYCINSVTHVFGSTPFETGDRARNLLWVAMLTAGSGWHNNHHAFPSTSRNDLLPGNFDPGGMLLRLLARFGLVWDLVVPTPEMIAAKRKR